MAKVVLILFVQAILLISVSSTQKRWIPDTTYFRLILALCSEDDGTIRKSCLQNVSSGTFIDDMFSRIFDQASTKNSNNKPGSVIDDVIGRTETLSVKRGREKMSGFYSNW